MLRVLSKLENSHCRWAQNAFDRDTSGNSPFRNFRFLQNYWPMLNYFKLPEYSEYENCELDSEYSIINWIKEISPQIWSANIINTKTEEASTGNIFIKNSHLIDPLELIKGEFSIPKCAALPNYSKSWIQAYEKIQSRDNQAYIDCFANFLFSHLREQDITPHCILFYGARIGISDSYEFKISDQFESIRNQKWFWSGMEKMDAHLKLDSVVATASVDADISNLDNTNNINNYNNLKNLLKNPFRNIQIDNTIENIEQISIDKLSDENMILENYSFDLIEEISGNIINIIKKDDSVDSPYSVESSDNSAYSDNDDLESEITESSGDDVEIVLISKNIPVITILQEANEGTLDSFLDMDEIDGISRNSKEWDNLWLAWVFQIVAGLSVLQKMFLFTHNDLHSNNIVWRRTQNKYLYYRSKSGCVWRVPTYGRIFSIIDFGRSIFQFKDETFISDDHFPGNYAGDQYNFGPFYNPERQEILPNPSFDLARLAVSLLDGLFEELPEPIKTKSKGSRKIINSETNWTVYETESHIFNLLWSWTVDDNGRTIYINKDYTERYPGFELYKVLATSVHNAVPREQLNRDEFSIFKIKTLRDIPENDKIYSIDVS